MFHPIVSGGAGDIVLTYRRRELTLVALAQRVSIGLSRVMRYFVGLPALEEDGEHPSIGIMSGVASKSRRLMSCARSFVAASRSEVIAFCVKENKQVNMSEIIYYSQRTIFVLVHACGPATTPQMHGSWLFFPFLVLSLSFFNARSFLLASFIVCNPASPHLTEHPPEESPKDTEMGQMLLAVPDKSKSVRISKSECRQIKTSTNE